MLSNQHTYVHEHIHTRALHTAHKYANFYKCYDTIVEREDTVFSSYFILIEDTAIASVRSSYALCTTLSA